MKRGWLILVFGLIVAAAAYGCIYFARTSSERTMERNEKPELAWLKDEFNLNDAEFMRVSDLHAAYLPQCQEMCRKIDVQNVAVQKLIAGATNVTPEIKSALTEASRLRADCQTMMLRHFIQVVKRCPRSKAGAIWFG